jgi:glycosyltransferase involved in cell wall biosynthesis
MNLKAALASRDDLDCVFIEVPFERGAIGRIPVFGANWTLRGSLRAWSRIRQQLGRGNLDALFLHTQTISIFAGGYMDKIPTLLSLDATPVNLDQLASSYGHSVGGGRIERLKRAAHMRVMKKARAYTTWSQWAKDSLVLDYGVDARQVTVVHPGTTLSNFPERRNGPSRADAPLRILFVGGDFARKGGDLLLDVWRNHLGGSCELDIVTAAELPEEPGVRVHHNVKPHSEQLLRLYGECDVFVLPTRGDCLAVVLGEAMAASMPIITTSVGAHAEAVEEGESGFVIDVDDGDALRDRIQQLASDRERVQRMGRRSRAIGEARFDMQKGAAAIGDILARIATGGTAPARDAVVEPATSERPA